MLSGAEGLASESGRIDHAFVKALAGEGPLAAKRSGKMPETFIAEGAVHEAHVVPEVARRARHQKFRCRRSVREPAIVFDDQTQGLQRGEQSEQQVLGNASRLCEPNRRVCAAIDMREQVEIERSEQRLGGHKPVGNGGNVSYVLNRLGLRPLPP